MDKLHLFFFLTPTNLEQQLYAGEGQSSTEHLQDALP